MTPLRFGSFCSGIGAPEVAWSRIGWKPQFFSEIEPFPCAVLAHHFPHTPNLGNMEKVDAQTLRRFAVDVVVAGTPCQSFSVAGLRAGMDDPRGNLALVFLRLVDWIRPRWVVWENVPGVHSSWSDEATFAPSEESRAAISEARRIAESAGFDLGADFCAEQFEEADQSNDFDSFIAGLEQLGYGVATRILDAQYFGVPQRRNRVFVVGYLGDWRRAAAVLLERHSLSGNPPPRRETGTRVAASLTRGADSGGNGGYAGRRREDDSNIVGTLTRTYGTQSGNGLGETENGLIVNCLDSHMGSGGPDDNAAQANHLIAAEVPAVCPAIKSRDYKGPSSDGDGDGAILVPMVAHSLRADGFDASEDGTGRGTPLVPVCYRTSGNCGVMEQGDLSAALTTSSDPNAQIVGMPIPILEVGKGTTSRGAGPNGCGIGIEGDPMFTLQAGAQHAIAFEQNQRDEVRLVNGDGGISSSVKAENGMKNQTYVSVAFQERGRDGGRNLESQAEVAYSLNAPAGGGRRQEMNVATRMAVRRLTPLECERLQGFPDGYTDIEIRGKRAADGPRYRALGNSMAVPVLEWIGRRIAAVDSLFPPAAPAGRSNE